MVSSIHKILDGVLPELPLLSVLLGGGRKGAGRLNSTTVCVCVCVCNCCFSLVRGLITVHSSSEKGSTLLCTMSFCVTVVIIRRS